MCSEQCYCWGNSSTSRKNLRMRTKASIEMWKHISKTVCPLNFYCFFSYCCIITDRENHLSRFLGWYWSIFHTLKILRFWYKIVNSQEKSGLKTNPCKMPREFCEDFGIFSLLQERRWIKGEMKVCNKSDT